MTRYIFCIGEYLLSLIVQTTSQALQPGSLVLLYQNNALMERVNRFLVHQRGQGQLAENPPGTETVEVHSGAAYLK